MQMDENHDRTALGVHEASKDICPICSASSRDQAIHCISVSPAPPPYKILPPRLPLSVRPAVPTLNVQTTEWSMPVRPPRPARAFQPDDSGRSRIRFRRNAFSPISPQTPVQQMNSHRSSQASLGIPSPPFKPDISPITPGTAEKAGRSQTRDEGSDGVFAASNLAQRIEQKLWKYSSSRNVLKRWLIEIVSWIISAVCMAGIITILIIYQNKPLPRWPLGMNLNTYISVLAKIASGALLLPVSEALGQLKWNWFRAKNPDQESKKMWDFELIDNASRGAWGSFVLILRTRGRSLAALAIYYLIVSRAIVIAWLGDGAMVTLFALAMDPFFQKVVDFPEQWLFQSTNGSISRATTYKVYSAGEYLQDDIWLVEIDQAMSAIAYHYFYDNGTYQSTGGKDHRLRPDIPVACPNSRCTWAQYESLGVCNRCVENKDLLEFRCLYSNLDWVPNPIAAPDSTIWIYPNGTACGWYLKSDNPILMTGYVTDLHTNNSKDVLVSRSQPLYSVWDRSVLSGYEAKLNDTRNPIAHFVTVSSENEEQVRLNATPVAHECNISWCVRTMNSTLSNGYFTEDITETVYNNTLGPDPWTAHQYFSGNKSLGVQFSYDENVTIIGKNGHRYEVENTTHSNVLGIFDDIFPSTYTVNSSGMTQARLRIRQYMTNYHRYRASMYNPWLYDNITTHLDNLAAEWTKMVRSSQPSIEMVPGTASDLVSVVLVQWEWLSLPLGLLGFTFIFLVATIMRSMMEQDVGVWKNSAIAILLHGLPDDIRKKLTSAIDKRASNTHMRDRKIKWLPGSGWRLSGVNHSSSPRASQTAAPTDRKERGKTTTSSDNI